MSPPGGVRVIPDDERQVLEDGLRSPAAFVLRRGQILLASDRGERVPQMARNVGCSAQPVRNVRHACNARGLATRGRHPSRPHTIHARFAAASDERLRERLHPRPRACGKPTSVWTLPLGAEVWADEGITATRVSAEPIRKTRKRLGLPTGWWGSQTRPGGAGRHARPCLPGPRRGSRCGWARGPCPTPIRPPRRWPVPACGCPRATQPGCASSMVGPSARGRCRFWPGVLTRA